MAIDTGAEAKAGLGSSTLSKAIERKDFAEVVQLGLRRAETSTDRTDAARDLVDLALWLEAEDRISEAIEFRIRALNLASSTNPDPRRIASEIERLANLFGRTDDWVTATQLMRIAADLTRGTEGEDSAAYQDRLHRLGDMLAEQGATIDGIAAHDEADAQARRYAPDRKRFSTMPLDDARKPKPGTKTAQIDIFYATDRNVLKQQNVYDRFGTERGDAMNFGIARVSVPRNRRPGSLERPGFFWQFFDGYENDSLFLIKGLAGIPTRQSWLERLREQIGKGGRRELLLYVHGFNTEFWEAIVRAAQLHVDLGINGATAAYSWPSRASSRAYDVDRTSIDVFWPKLKELIRDLAEPFAAQPGAPLLKPRLIIVAHSMGCDYALKALERLKIEWDADKSWVDSCPIDEVVFAAPDVDLEVFKRDAPAVAKISKRVTAYCCEADAALWLSRTVVHRYERAGRKAEALVGLGVDGIDTTTTVGALLGDLIRHNDYATTALFDVKAVLCGDNPDQRVNLDPANVADGIYWSMMPQRLATEAGQNYAKSVDERRQTTPLPEPLTL